MKKVKLSLLLVAMGMLALVACKDKDKVKENSTIPAKQQGTGNTETWRIPTAEEVIGRWESSVKIEHDIDGMKCGITKTEIYSAGVDADGKWYRDTVEIVWGGEYSLKDGVLSFVDKGMYKKYGVELELKYTVRVHEGKLKMKLSEEDFRAARVKLLEKLKEEVEKREGKEKEAIKEAIWEWNNEWTFEKRMKIATAERVFSRFKGM